MISSSVVLMTLVDLAVLGATAFAAITLYRFRAPVASLGATSGALLMMAGFTVIAALFLADLAIMHLLPSLLGMERAMRTMHALLLHGTWGVILVGLTLAIAGFALLTRTLLPQMHSALRAMEARNAALSSNQVELENRFLATAEAVPIGIVIARRDDGRLLFANAVWRQMMRIAPEDLDHSATDLYADPLQRAELLDAIEKDGRAGPIEISARRADGSTFWAMMSSIGIKFDGEPAVLSGLLDTTDQHASQQQLAESERRFRAIAEATPYPLFIARRRDGRLLYHNQKLVDAIGFADDSLVHYSTELYWDLDDRAALLDTLAKDGRRQATEVRHRTAAGEMFWAITTSVALEFDGEEAILTSFIDISDRKTIEAELAQHRDRLEDMVDERARELREAQDELIRKERLATVGQVTATVGHELRNPLGTISTSFELLRKELDTDDPRSLRAVQRIDRNMQRCSRIIDELLDYTRIRPIRLKPVHVDSWLGQLVREIETDARIELVTSLEADAHAHADIERLRQALLNVIENGRQSMDDNEPDDRALTLRSRLMDGRVEIEISDRGTGISADDMQNIFEPLFSTRAFGVGLGLPLVKHIMAEHHGGIEVSSEPGAGTRVLLWLPVSERVGEMHAQR